MSTQRKFSWGCVCNNPQGRSLSSLGIETDLLKMKNTQFAFQQNPHGSADVVGIWLHHYDGDKEVQQLEAFSQKHPDLMDEVVVNARGVFTKSEEVAKKLLCFGFMFVGSASN